VLQHVLLPLTELSAGSRERIRAVVYSGNEAGVAVVPRLVTLLSHMVMQVRASALGVIANICSASAYTTTTAGDSEINTLIHAGVLPLLLKLLHGSIEHGDERAVIRRACRVLANICAGTTKQLVQVLDMDRSSRLTPTGRFVPLMRKLLKDCGAEDMDVLEEVVWVLANASHGANHAEVRAAARTLVHFAYGNDPHKLQ
jgi:hypothetical protein